MSASPNRVTLAAVGDLSFARGAETTFHEKGASYLFEEARDDLAAADFRFGNLESVLLPSDFPLERTSGRPLQSRDAVLDALRPLRFDVLNMAANHVLDCGWRGLLHSYDCIRSLGAQPLGAGPDQQEARALRVVEAKGTRIGFLGYLQPGDWTLEGGGGRIAYLRAENVIADLRKHRNAVDVLVVSIHGDIEFQPAPSIPRLNLCRAIAEAGADLVLCHHPHVPQGIEQWGSCLIHYSLGNFLFDLRGYQLSSSPEVVRSHLFLVEIENGRICGWKRKFYRIHSEEGGRPRPLPTAECEAEEAYYRDLDALLAQPDRLRELWHGYCLRRFSGLMEQFAADAKLDPMLFLKRYGRLLFSDMAHEYLGGMLELAEAEYRRHAFGDYEFKRPYAPYETDA